MSSRIWSKVYEGGRVEGGIKEKKKTKIKCLSSSSRTKRDVNESAS